MEIISRKAAVLQGLKFYFTGKPCKHGHLVRRITASQSCETCNKIRITNWSKRPANRAKLNAAKAARRKANKVLPPTLTPEEMELKQQDRRARQLESKRKYYRKNREKYLQWDTSRYIKETTATPKWMKHSVFFPIYKVCKYLSEALGPHHVDHIVPIVHPLVCGLHVPWNLQIIPAEENLRKNNKFNP